MSARLSSVLARNAASVRAASGRLLRALLWWRRPPPGERPFVAPFVGEYRTRPWEPPPPPGPARANMQASPRRSEAVCLLLSLAFVAVGVLLALFPHKPSDRFWGLCSAGFFGLCAWVFLQQLLAPKGQSPVAVGSALRMVVALFLTGAGGVYLAWTSDGAGITLFDRLFCGVFSAGFLGISVWAAVVAHRNGRLLRPVLRRRRRPPSS